MLLCISNSTLFHSGALLMNPLGMYHDYAMVRYNCIVNPRQACAARVTVLGLCVSSLVLALQAPNRLMSDTNGSSATSARKIMWQFH